MEKAFWAQPQPFFKLALRLKNIGAFYMTSESSQSPHNGVEHEPSKLSTILNRFRKTHDRISTQTPKDVPVAARKPENVVKADGLSALPQPEMVDGLETHAMLEWPVLPQFVDPKATESFEKLGVSPEMCQRLHELDYKEAFAVQTAVIPLVLKTQASLTPDPPAPILVNSFTGSGKTLAYSVPIIDILRTRRIPRVRALILLPTKVLISQVHQILELLSKGTGLRIMSFRSDRTLTREAQVIETDVPDIIVSAPGRLVEHISRNPKLLNDLKLLVVDEADRLVGQPFQNWTETLAKHLPVVTHPPCTANNGHVYASLDRVMWHRAVQRLIFSATLTRDPAKLSALQIRSQPPALPHLLVVGNEKLDGGDEFLLPSQLSERLLKARSLGDKPLALTSELLTNCQGRILVFVKSNEAAARLARLITLVSSMVFGRQLDAHKCSGEMRVQDRRRVLKEFENNDEGVLICTDLIARGIDMPIDYVINYDVPSGAREYVHRVGRTARAGADGHAWTLVAPGGELKHFHVIQRQIRRIASIEETDVDPAVDMEKYQQTLQELGQEVNRTN